jgi:hypothetical protein
MDKKTRHSRRRKGSGRGMGEQRSMEKSGKGEEKWRNITGKRNKMKLLSWLVLHPIHQKKKSLPND